MANETRSPHAAAALVVLLMVSASGGVAGDPGGFHASFDPKPGNEWWVEVYVDGTEPLAGVDARADGGDWIALEKKDWGAWTRSFHVPEGTIVEFQARATSGETVQSGCYQWTGAEKVDCPGDGDGDEGDDSDLEVTYDPRPGNEWWVEVYVTTHQPLAGVEARGDGGEWHPLSKRDWGVWAGSFHVPEGTVVDFRATMSTGAQDTSGCYRWTGADPVACPGDGGSDPTGTFDAAFAPKGGADDWVEVIVDSTETNISAVDVRVDGGEWQPLELQPWHAWTASMSAPAGSDVAFRAASTEGDTATSIPYRWTEAEPADGHGGGFEADFRPKAGNEWWVEVYVDGNEPLTLVQARVNDGEWRDLEKKSWGAWADSFHVPDGSIVTFRAHDGDGERDLSGTYVWPDATKASDAPPHHGWPHEGSYAVYSFSTGFAEHTGGPVTVGNITFIYHGTAWQVHCFGYTEEQHDGSREPYSERGAYPPPRMDEQVAVGDETPVPSPGCGTGAYNPVEVQGQEPRDTRYHGEPITITTWHGSYIAEDCLCFEDWGYWETDTGLVHSTGHAGNHEGNYALLKDTDAPLR